MCKCYNLANLLIIIFLHMKNGGGATGLPDPPAVSEPGR